MSLDRSLKTKGALARHRNVLTRAERIVKLMDEDAWQEGENVTGLPKVSNRKATTGKKSSKKKDEEEQQEA